jgi:hypothetical protein
MESQKLIGGDRVIVLMSWDQFLKMAPKVAEEYEKAHRQCLKEGNPDAMDAFYYRFVRKNPDEYWDGRADEYGERAWRIAGEKYSLIVLDEGNGWSYPLGVEIVVDRFKFATKQEVKSCSKNP